MKISLLTETAKIPTRGTKYSAGWDLYLDKESDDEYLIGIPPHKTKLLSTGISAEIPIGYFGGLFARSGLATKQGLRPANCVGIIDSDYRGIIKVPLYNDSDEWRYLNYGDRIAQLILIPYQTNELEVVSKLSETERGIGGFGSTGTSL